MKWFLVLVAFMAGYMYFLTHTVSTVLTQAQSINTAYQNVSKNSYSIATGNNR